MRYFVISFVLLCWSCGSPVTTDDLELLNGYWEIEEVRTEAGETRSYPASTTIDYIEVRDMEGYRKKVQPNFDGSFSTSDDAVEFRIVRRGEALFLLYLSGNEKWEEELTTLERERFSLKTQGGVTYQYKRFEPIKL